MSATPRPPARVLPQPDVLRRKVMDKLAHLADAEVAVLHDPAHDLELRAAWREFSVGMADDWAAGNYEHLGEALASARAAIRAAAHA